MDLTDTQWAVLELTRWEYHAENFLGMVQLACARILFRPL